MGGIVQCHDVMQCNREANLVNSKRKALLYAGVILHGIRKVVNILLEVSQL